MAAGLRFSNRLNPTLQQRGVMYQGGLRIAQGMHCADRRQTAGQTKTKRSPDGEPKQVSNRQRCPTAIKIGFRIMLTDHGGGGRGDQTFRSRQNKALCTGYIELYCGFSKGLYILSRGLKNDSHLQYIESEVKRSLLSTKILSLHNIIITLVVYYIPTFNLYFKNE